jgi:hypothetical protein
MNINRLLLIVSLTLAVLDVSAQDYYHIYTKNEGIVKIDAGPIDSVKIENGAIHFYDASTVSYTKLLANVDSILILQEGNLTLALTEDVTSLLRNPCMGWGLYDDAIQEVQPADDYWSVQNEAAHKYASFFYIRWRWSDIEPEEGKYAWIYDENYKKLIKGALDRGLKLCFRIFDNGQDMHHQATPEYVRLAGAEGYTVTGGGKVHWTPYPDDPVFQAKFTKFVEAFAKEYDNPDVVDFIDGFNIGWWGEAHHIVLKDMSKLESVFDFITTLYSSNFKKIILTIPFNNQVGFATERRIAYDKKGYAMRRDGLGSQWFTDTEQSYTLIMFGKTLLVGESCYWGGSPYFTDDTRYNLKTWRDVFELTYKQAINYHFNTLDLRELFETEKWTGLASDLVVNFTINGGYRLYPPEISLPEHLTAGKDAVIGHSWENTGSGYLPNNLPNWAYKYQTAFALLNDKGEAVKIWTDEKAEPSQWHAGKIHSYQLTINTEGIAVGDYHWAVAIIDTTKNNTPGIKLAIADHTPVNGWIPLIPVDVK